MLERMTGMWILVTVNLALGDSGLNLHSGIQGGKKHRKSDDRVCLPQDGSKNLTFKKIGIMNPLMSSSSQVCYLQIKICSQRNSIAESYLFSFKYP